MARLHLTKEEASAMGKKGGILNKGKKRPQTIKKIEARLALRTRFELKADQYFKAWEDCALGHFVEVTTPTGQVTVYKKSPDAKAIRDIYEHVYGKAPMAVDITSGGEKINLKVEFIPNEHPISIESATDISTEEV